MSLATPAQHKANILRQTLIDGQMSGPPQPFDSAAFLQDLRAK